MASTKRELRVETYEWAGKNRQGEAVNGVNNASSLTLLKAELRRQGITPTKVRKKAQPLFSFKKPVSSKEITVITRQIATMITAGIPLIQAFELVIRGQENREAQTLLSAIKVEIESGTPFSIALAKHPLYFDELFCNLVAAGEQAGALDTMLSRLATYQEKTESLKAKIKKALMYPIAVLAIAFIVTAILMVFVVPQFQGLFSSFGAQLPALTLMVIQLSKCFTQYWSVMVGGIALSVWGMHKAKKTSHAVAHRIDRTMLRLPIIGMILTKAVIARYARTLATTFAAGLPLIDALRTVAGAAGNSIYSQAILRIREQVATGQPLQLAMQASQRFPMMVIQMVAIGEESGTLEKMLAKVADLYEEEVDNAVDNLSNLIEPFILVFLGVVVGGLVVAMYLPIFKMGSVIH